MRVELVKGVFDKNFYNCLIGTGIYIDDTFAGKRINGEATTVIDINNLKVDENFEFVDIALSNEKTPVTSDQIISILQLNTIFGLNHVLFKNLPIADLKIYYGANQTSLQLIKNENHQTRSYKSYPYIVEYTKTPIVEFIYIDERSNLIAIKRPINDYITNELLMSLARHAYAPKVGIKISSLFPQEFFIAKSPLADWIFIRDEVSKIVQEDLKRHTKSQVDRISKRVASVQHRARVNIANIDFGLVPINEVETVLLFQKIILSNPSLLPGGLKVNILDYSPKDIDSICRFQISPNHPEETGPVEFEYSLSSFFKHGHDYRQVKLIICYTAEPLTFPYFHGGINYILDRSGEIPRLTNKLDHTSIPCLIIKDLLK
jgi:hypothetical protein